MISGYLSNPYLDPTSNYGADKNLYDTAVSTKLGNTVPLTEWTRMTAMNGYGGNDRRGAFAQNQFSKFNNAFQAAQLRNPFLGVRDFMKQSGIGDQLEKEWLGLSAAQRGLNNQSRTNIVRWG